MLIPWLQTVQKSKIKKTEKFQSLPSSGTKTLLSFSKDHFGHMFVYSHNIEGKDGEDINPLIKLRSDTDTISDKINVYFELS